MAKLFFEDAERRFLLDLRPGESLVVGRSPRCDVPLAAPRASRRHAEFLPHGAGHAIRDLGSTNGTTLNGAPFTGAPTLADGDVIDASGCRIVYRARP